MNNNYQYQAFYKDLVNRYWINFPKRPKPVPSGRNNMPFSSGVDGIVYGWSFHTNNRFSSELYIDTGDKQRNTEILQELNDVVGEKPDGFYRLHYEELPQKRACRIAVYKNAYIDDVSNKAREKEELLEWAVKKMILIEETFKNPLRNLSSI